MPACLRILAALSAHRDHAKDEVGATATEYGVLMGFLAMVITTGVAYFGEQLDLYYQTIVAALPW